MSYSVSPWVHNNCVQRDTLSAVAVPIYGSQFFSLSSPISSHPINSINARMSNVHGFYAVHGRLARESIDPAIHFQDGGRKRARQRHFKEWQTEKPSEIDRGLSMCLGFIVGHISSCLYHCGISKLCVFFCLLGMCGYVRDPQTRNRASSIHKT